MEITATLAEQLLVERAAGGDHEAFAALFDRYARDVFRHAVRQLESIDDAEDVLAMVFLHAWRRRRDVRVVNGSARAWLLMTTNNLCRNHRRARRRYRAVLTRLGAPNVVADPADEVVERHAVQARGRQVAAMLAGLDPLDRQIVALCLIGELTYGDVAELLGISHASVRSRLSRARRRLRGQLEEVGIAGVIADQEEEAR